MKISMSSRSWASSGTPGEQIFGAGVKGADDRLQLAGVFERQAAASDSFVNACRRPPR